MGYICINIYIYINDMQKPYSVYEILNRNRDSEISKNANEKTEQALLAPFEGREIIRETIHGVIGGIINLTLAENQPYRSPISFPRPPPVPYTTHNHTRMTSSDG